MTRYAGTLRPISIGCFPKYNDNKVLDIVNFDDKSEMFELDCWGYIDYENDIPEADAESYDLVLVDRE